MNKKDWRPKNWGGTYWKFLQTMRRIHPADRPSVYIIAQKAVEKVIDEDWHIRVRLKTPGSQD